METCMKKSIERHRKGSVKNKRAQCRVDLAKTAVIMMMMTKNSFQMWPDKDDRDRHSTQGDGHMSMSSPQQRSDSDSLENNKDSGAYQKNMKQTKKNKLLHKNKGEKEKSVESDYTTCKAGPKVFSIFITQKQWNKIKP